MKNILNKLSLIDKKEYLKNVIYENVTHSRTGKLLINTNYCRKTAELLGGNYDELSKIQKDIFKAFIVTEEIYIEDGFEKFMNY